MGCQMPFGGKNLHVPNIQKLTSGNSHSSVSHERPSHTTVISARWHGFCQRQLIWLCYPYSRSSVCGTGRKLQQGGVRWSQESWDWLSGWTATKIPTTGSIIQVLNGRIGSSVKALVFPPTSTERVLYYARYIENIKNDVLMSHISNRYEFILHL